MKSKYLNSSSTDNESILLINAFSSHSRRYEFKPFFIQKKDMGNGISKKFDKSLNQ